MPYFVADRMDLLHCVGNILWLSTKCHGLRPHFLVWKLELQTSLQAKVHSLTNLHLCELLFSQVLLHLLQPEIHGIIYDFDRAPFHNGCCRGWVAKVSARLDQALIVEADCAGMNEAGLN